jgi:hypothetical protein
MGSRRINCTPAKFECRVGRDDEWECYAMNRVIGRIVIALATLYVLNTADTAGEG